MADIAKLLLVADTEAQADALQLLLLPLGFLNIALAPTPGELNNLLQADRPSAILLTCAAATQHLSAIKAFYAQLPRIVLLAEAGEANTALALLNEASVDRVCPIPPNVELLTSIVKAELQAARATVAMSELERLQKDLDIVMRDYLFSNAVLAEQHTQLASMFAVKSEFLSSVSHELRTPMTVIIGYTEILLKQLRGDIPPHLYSFLASIKSNGSHLLSLINNILDLSKIEAGKAELVLDTFTISEFAEDMQSVLQGLLLGSLVQARLDISEEQAILVTDYKKLKQIAINLLGNAVKFTKRGTIAISLSVADGFVTMRVSDTGIGIPPEQQGAIFEAFSQLHVPGMGKTVGTGLGLTISKRLTALLSGDIAVESTSGVGSTFTVRIPQSLKAPDSPELSKTASLDDLLGRYNPEKTAIAISSSEAETALIAEAMAEYGFRTLPLKDAPDAAVLLLRFAPRVAFVDMDMEYPSFGDFVDSIANARQSIIGLSNDEAGYQAFKLGIKDYAMRPLSLSKIREVYEKNFIKKPSVLLIDDDVNITKAYSRILYKKGYNVLLANNHDEAMGVLRSTAVDLISVDLMMPGVSGFDFIDVLRADADLKDIPVLVITGKHLSDDEMKHLKRKKISVLDKGSFNTQALEKAVFRALGQRKLPVEEPL